MADQAPITPAAPAATFDVAVWLSRFESVGGSYLATENQTSFCLACEDVAPGQSPAHAMLRELTDQQRTEVVEHIRARSGLAPTLPKIDNQPDLNAIPLEKLSEAAAISAASGGSTLDDQSKGTATMDMIHDFVPTATNAGPTSWDQIFTAYEAAKAAEDIYDATVWKPAQKRQDEFEALVGIKGDKVEDAQKRRALIKKFPNEYVADEVNEKIEHLQDIRIDLEQALMEMPAPDFNAFRWKLRSHRRMSEFSIIDPDVSDAILSELDRLLAEPSVVVSRSHRSNCHATLLPNPRAEWDAAVARYRAAELAVEAADHSDESLDHLLDCKHKLMNTPAPDGKAAMWKLDYLLADAGDGYPHGYHVDTFAQPLADLRRLLGVA